MFKGAVLFVGVTLTMSLHLLCKFATWRSDQCVSLARDRSWARITTRETRVWLFDSQYNSGICQLKHLNRKYRVVPPYWFLGILCKYKLRIFL